MNETGSSIYMKTASFLVETRRIFVEGWPFTKLHGVISPNNIILVVFTVRNSNLSFYIVTRLRIIIQIITVINTRQQ